MEDKLAAYEEEKRAIRFKKAKMKESDLDFALLERDFLQDSPQRTGITDVAQVGSKVVIGAGLGLLAGVATIAVVASAAEIVIAGVVTKIAGVVGGTAGLSMGLRSVRKKKEKVLSKRES
jgi:uncharacterized membrane protein